MKSAKKDSNYYVLRIMRPDRSVVHEISSVRRHSLSIRHHAC